MSEPACVWVIENGQCKYYYNHHLGNCISSELLLGEKYLLRWAEYNGQWPEAVDILTPFWEQGILDEGGIDVSGGIVIDLDRKVLLFWQWSENRIYPIDYRWLVDLMQITWPGWTVRYAADEDFDIQRYVHWRRTGKILAGPDIQRDKSIVLDVFGLMTIVSIREIDGQVRHYKLPSELAGSFIQGPEMIADIYKYGVPCALEPYDQDHQYWGLVMIDLPTKHVWLYTSASWCWRAAQLSMRTNWPGWKVDFHFGWIYQHCGLIDMDWTQVLKLPVDFVPGLAKFYGQGLRGDDNADFYGEGIPVCIDPESGETRLISSSESDRRKLVETILNNWRSKGGSPTASLGKACEWLDLEELLPEA